MTVPCPSLMHCPHCLGFSQIIRDPVVNGLFRVQCRGGHGGSGCGATTPAFSAKWQAATFWNIRGPNRDENTERLAIPSACQVCKQYATVGQSTRHPGGAFEVCCPAKKSMNECGLMRRWSGNAALLVGSATHPDMAFDAEDVDVGRGAD